MGKKIEQVFGSGSLELIKSKKADFTALWTKYLNYEIHVQRNPKPPLEVKKMLHFMLSQVPFELAHCVFDLFEWPDSKIAKARHYDEFLSSLTDIERDTLAILAKKIPGFMGSQQLTDPEGLPADSLLYKLLNNDINRADLKKWAREGSLRSFGNDVFVNASGAESIRVLKRGSGFVLRNLGRGGSVSK